MDIGAFEFQFPCGVPLVVITTPASCSVNPVNTPISFTGTFDPADGPHTASWNIDGNVQPGSVNEVSGTVTDTFTGVKKTYSNPAKKFGSQGDTTAIPSN